MGVKTCMTITIITEYSYRVVRMLLIDNSALEKFRAQIEDSLFKVSTRQKRGQGIQKVARNNLEKIEHKGLFALLEEMNISIEQR